MPDIGRLDKRQNAFRQNERYLFSCFAVFARLRLFCIRIQMCIAIRYALLLLQIGQILAVSQCDAGILPALLPKMHVVIVKLKFSAEDIEDAAFYASEAIPQRARRRYLHGAGRRQVTVCREFMIQRTQQKRRAHRRLRRIPDRRNPRDRQAVQRV